MAYRRWSHSYWYIYHSALSGRRKGDQMIDIDCNWSYYYHEIADDIDAVVAAIITNARTTYGAEHHPKSIDIQDLYLALEEFVDNIDKQYQLPRIIGTLWENWIPKGYRRTRIYSLIRKYRRWKMERRFRRWKREQQK